MHILIIPFGHYIIQKAPLSGIFQYHQARAFRKKGINVGVISAGFVPFKRQFFKYPYPPFDEKEYGAHIHAWKHPHTGNPPQPQVPWMMNTDETGVQKPSAV